MTLLAPIWLFLLIPVGLSLWLWRPPTRFQWNTIPSCERGI